MRGGGGHAHYVMVSKIQWRPFGAATQLYPQNDWAERQKGVSFDVFARGPIVSGEKGVKRHKDNVLHEVVCGEVCNFDFSGSERKSAKDVSNLNQWWTHHYNHLDDES